MSSTVVRMSWGRWSSALKTISGSVRPYGADRTRDLLSDLCRRRRFILGERLSAASVPEGGHSLGPLGSEMKKNIIKEWWNMVALSPEHILPIDTALHAPPEPGPPALTLFRIRPDHRDNDERQLGILRHDLLHGALSHYAACLDLVSGKLPFGIAEVGKCFHTVPVQGDDGAPLTRSGERTAASLCWFSSAKTASQWRDYWLRHRLLWWRRFAQVPSGFSSGDHQDADGAKTLVINYDFPWGAEAVETLRTMDDSALTQVHAGTGAKLHGRDGRRSLVPHVVWLSSDLDRALLAYLSDALHVTENLSPRGKEHVRTVLRLHPSLAPIKVAVDLGKGPAVDLRLVCQGLSSDLRGSGISVWPGYLDTVQTPMEQLFTKYDEMGVLFTVLVSDVTLESGLLHLRNRDTTIKETVHVSKLRAFLTQYMSAANKM